MSVLYDADLTLQVHVRNAHAGSDKHQDIDAEIKRELKKIMEGHSNPNVQFTFYPNTLSIHNIRNDEKTQGDVLASKADEDYQDSLSHTTDVHGTKKVPYSNPTIPSGVKNPSETLYSEDKKTNPSEQAAGVNASKGIPQGPAEGIISQQPIDQHRVDTPNKYPPHKEEEKAGPKESAENLSKYTK